MDAAALAHATFESLKASLDVRAGGRIVPVCSDAFSSGFPGLDQALAGGFAPGTIAALEGTPSSGRTAVLAGTLRQATQRGLAAIVDDGSLYPPDLERAGVRLDRLLVVSARGALETARCADILLRSRAFGVVAMPAAHLRATVWSRLAGLVHKSGAVLVVLGVLAGAELAYFASTRVRCGIERVIWSQASGMFCELAGYDIRAHVLKHRRGAPGCVAHLRIAREIA